MRHWQPPRPERSKEMLSSVFLFGLLIGIVAASLAFTLVIGVLFVPGVLIH